MNILGVIPARAGSKGVPGKNLIEIGGRSLIERAVASALESERLSRVLFTTEDAGYRDIALKAGAEAPFLRPAELATDTAGTWDVMRHAVNWLEENEGWSTDYLVVLQPTTPFRTGAHIDATIALVLDEGAEAALSIREVDYPPQWMMLRESNGRMKPLIEGGPKVSRRQDAATVYQPNGLVYVLPRARLDHADPIMVTDKRGYIMDFADSINIDDPWQVDLARIIEAKRA
ncbi:MAG: acylneuraminate cytidylyltransferase family protein [Rhodospirillaceae bacterium]